MRKLSQIDLLSLSGHKFHGPKGVGALFVRRGTKLHSLIVGGPQEKTRRGGTENVPSIIGMGKAADLASIYLGEESTRVRKLRDQLETGLLNQIPELRVNGDRETRIPNTTNVTFKGLDGRKLLKVMEANGIYATSGAVCTEGKSPSHVLLAMGLAAEDAFSSVRFALSRYNTEAEIAYAAAVITLMVSHMRAGMYQTLKAHA